MFVRRFVLSMVALAAALLPVALAQQVVAPPWNWMVTAQVYLSDQGLQKELELTAEQIKKANELAQSGFSRLTERFRADEKKLKEIDEAIKKDLTDFLKPQQMTRLRQVILQNTARNPFGGTSLAADAELVKQLKLSDEQVKKLRARTRFDDVLTEDQQKEWKKLAGKPYTGTLLARGFPDRSRPLPALPLTLHHLTASSVQDDLKLSEDQQSKLAELKKKYEKALRETTDAKKGQELESAGNKEARAVLKNEQMKRLDQIQLQLATQGEEFALLTHRSVVDGLKLTQDQQEKIQTTHDKRRKEMLELFAADEEPKKIIDKVKAFKKETGTQLRSVLNEKQQAALKELVGATFTGEIPPLRSTRFGPRSQTSLSLYVTGAAYVASPDLHKELKLDADTAKKLTAFAEKVYQAGVRVFRTDDKTLKTTAEANKKELGGILDAKQMKRFEEAYWQRLVNLRPSPFGSSIHRYVEVQEALKLTDDQKDKLNSGSNLAKVLDESQAKKWKEMLGEPFKGTLVLPRRARGDAPFFGSAQPLRLLAVKTPAVSDELKLTMDQQKKIAEAEKTWQEADKKARGNRDFAEFRKAAQAAIEALTVEIRGILDKKQNTRLEQIVLQGTQRSGLRALLNLPDIKEKLEIDDEQQKKIASILEETTNLQNLLFTEYGLSRRGRDDPNREGYAKAQEAINKNLTKRLEATLTGKQKGQLKELLGAPFKGEIELPRGGRGGGFGSSDG